MLSNCSSILRVWLSGRLKGMQHLIETESRFLKKSFVCNNQSAVIMICEWQTARPQVLRNVTAWWQRGLAFHDRTGLNADWTNAGLQTGKQDHSYVMRNKTDGCGCINCLPLFFIFSHSLPQEKTVTSMPSTESYHLSVVAKKLHDHCERLEPALFWHLFLSLF